MVSQIEMVCITTPPDRVKSQVRCTRRQDGLLYGFKTIRTLTHFSFYEIRVYDSRSRADPSSDFTFSASSTRPYSQTVLIASAQCRTRLRSVRHGSSRSQLSPPDRTRTPHGPNTVLIASVQDTTPIRLHVLSSSTRPHSQTVLIASVQDTTPIRLHVLSSSSSTRPHSQTVLITSRITVKPRAIRRAERRAPYEALAVG